jgi:crotonobetainyl-CoA:carnitine CoA-transferase CaiB-like acyl-CoA transferase
MNPLADVRIVNLATRLPGPVAVAQLCRLGATAVKIEPPEGDPLYHACPKWYDELHAGIEVVSLNLKNAIDRPRVDPYLAAADLLITSTRPTGLARLGLAWPDLHTRFPRLCQVAIVGHEAPHEDQAGHDLTYQAKLGLLDPPHLPRALIADSAGAQEVVTAAMGLILHRERSGSCEYAEVSLAASAGRFAQPLHRGLTASGGLVGGEFAGYNLYRAREGWVALAALEPHFWQRLAQAVGHQSPSREQLAAFFSTRAADEWEAWGRTADVPVVAVREV